MSVSNFKFELAYCLALTNKRGKHMLPWYGQKYDMHYQSWRVANTIGRNFWPFSVVGHYRVNP